MNGIFSYLSIKSKNLSVLEKLKLINCGINRVDPDSNLFKDLQTFKSKDGKDHILLNFIFKVIWNRTNYINYWYFLLLFVSI